MNNNVYTGLIVFIGFLFSQCNPTTLPYTIIYSEEEPIGEICRTLETVLEKNFNVDIILINNTGAGSEANIDSLVSNDEIDFTITENHVPFREGVKSVLVLYPQILHIFYKDNYDPKNFQELVVGKTLYIGKANSGSYRFMMSLFEFFHVDTSNVTITDDPSSDHDIFVTFRDILSDDYLSELKGFKLYSLNDDSQTGNGSIVDAISLKNPLVKPFIIPQFTYGDKTPKPVYTISSDAVLVASTSMRDVPVTDMIKTIFKEKEVLLNISPLISKGMTESFDRNSLNFPLHEGARIYLDRDEPTFFERYAELFGVILSISIALTSGIISLSRWQKQKKKDRVDVFYKVLLEIKNNIPKIKTSKDAIGMIKEIQTAQNTAFEMLINEELEANESFRIFMELSKETILDIKTKIRLIQAKNQA